MHIQSLSHNPIITLQQTNNESGLPWWGQGSKLDCGSRDPGSIPSIPSSRIGPLMARRLKAIFGPGASAVVGSASKRPVAAHGVAAW